MKHQKTASKGFTLIEILVVIAIIGILSGILITALRGSRENALRAKATSDLRQVYTAITLYANDNGGRLPGPSYAGVGAGFRSFDQTLARYVAPYLDAPMPDGSEYSWVPALLPEGFEEASGNFDERRKGPAYMLNLSKYSDDNYSHPMGYPGTAGTGDLGPKSILTIPSPAEDLLMFSIDVENIPGSPGWINRIAQYPIFGEARPYLYWDGHVKFETMEEREARGL
jgi:prepilin-type N-terminal cleavage/methylation domain-containing protein/prepilin-type processing-associated H-X9-DG protein